MAPGCSQVPGCLSQLFLRTLRMVRRLGSSSNGFLALPLSKFALCLKMLREARLVRPSANDIYLIK